MILPSDHSAEVMSHVSICRSSKSRTGASWPAKGLSRHPLHILGSRSSHWVQNDIAFVTTRDHISAVRADLDRFDLVVDGLDPRLVRLIHEIYHPHRVILLDQIDVRSRAGPDLHLETDSLQLDPFDNLMQLEVANEEIVTLSDVANVAGKIIIEEYSLSFVLRADLIVD